MNKRSSRLVDKSTLLLVVKSDVADVRAVVERCNEAPDNDARWTVDALAVQVSREPMGLGDLLRLWRRC